VIVWTSMASESPNASPLSAVSFDKRFTEVRAAGGGEKTSAAPVVAIAPSIRTGIIFDNRLMRCWRRTRCERGSRAAAAGYAKRSHDKSTSHDAGCKRSTQDSYSHRSPLTCLTPSQNGACKRTHSQCHSNRMRHIPATDIVLPITRQCASRPRRKASVEWRVDRHRDRNSGQGQCASECVERPRHRCPTKPQCAE